MLVVGLGSALAQQPPATPQTGDPEAATRLFDEGRYAEATEALRAILAQKPDDRTATILLPFALARQGQTAQAVEEARRGLAIFPDNRKLQLLLGGLLVGQKETADEGREWLLQVLRVEPDNRLAQIGLAEAEMNRGNVFGAIERFTAIAEKAPTDERLQVRIAQGWATLGDLERSVEYFRRAHDLAPTNIDAVRSLAILSDVLDRPRDALEYYQRLGVLFPTDVSIQVAVRNARDALEEPQLPVPVEEMQKIRLENYTQALEKNSAQIKKRMEQISATQVRSAARFLPQFFVSPSSSEVNSEQRTRAGRDETTTLGFSFGWSIPDLFVDPYAISAKGLQADLASVRASLQMEATSTYYQRLNELMSYRTLQRQLALDPGNAQVRQTKRTAKFGILNLTKRLEILTGQAP
jgi:tetratricopeptide (TPR) repeat protein